MGKPFLREQPGPSVKASIARLGLVKMLRGRSDFKMLESDLEIRHANGSLIRVDGFDDQERVDKMLGLNSLLSIGCKTKF